MTKPVEVRFPPPPESNRQTPWALATFQQRLCCSDSQGASRVFTGDRTAPKGLAAELQRRGWRNVRLGDASDCCPRSGGGQGIAGNVVVGQLSPDHNFGNGIAARTQNISRTGPRAWTCTAAQLASSSLIAVYPVTGWSRSRRDREIVEKAAPNSLIGKRSFHGAIA